MSDEVSETGPDIAARISDTAGKIQYVKDCDKCEKRARSFGFFKEVGSLFASFSIVKSRPNLIIGPFYGLSRTVYDERINIVRLAQQNDAEYIKFREVSSMCRTSAMYRAALLNEWLNLLLNRGKEVKTLENQSFHFIRCTRRSLPAFSTMEDPKSAQSQFPVVPRRWFLPSQVEKTTSCWTLSSLPSEGANA